MRFRRFLRSNCSTGHLDRLRSSARTLRVKSPQQRMILGRLWWSVRFTSGTAQSFSFCARWSESRCSRYALALHAKQKIAPILPAISRHRRELFPVPFHAYHRSHCHRLLQAQAGAGTGGIFQRRLSAAGCSTRVLPADLRYCPYQHASLDFTPVHARCIGQGVSEFSYQWM